MDRSKMLGESNISALLFKFSMPAIIGMLVNALYNVVDRIIVGRGVGTLAIAGITIGFPIMIVMMAFGMLIGIGATSIISIRLGEKKKEEAELTMTNAMVLMILIAVGMTFFGLLFLDPLLQFFGASEAVLPYAREYLSIILWGALFQVIGFGMNNFIRAEGNPLISMGTMLIGAVLNGILSYIFVVNFNMGIRGAAIATVIAQGVSSAWVLGYFLSGKSALKIRRKNLKLRWDIVKGILAIGSAPFAMQIAASVLTAILNNKLAFYGGDIAISAIGIINSISMFILMPIFGINQGAQPIIGFNYGAQKYDRVKQALKLAMIAATSIVVVGYVAIQLFPEALIRMFNDKDAELIAFGAKGLRMFLIFLPVIGFQIVGANYFQAVGKPKQAMILSLSRQVLLLIPALYILPHFFGLNGVLMAGPFADLGSSVITGVWLWMELRQLKARHEACVGDGAA